MLGSLPLSAAAHGYLALLLGIWAASVGVPIPEEIPLLSAGILAALGIIEIPEAIAVGLFACVTGDLLVYGLGRRIGSHLNEHPYLRRIMRGRYLLRARHLYVRRGPWTLLVARLLPGLKMPFIFTAGALRMPFQRFLLYDVLSVSVLVPSLVLVAYHSSLSVAQLDRLFVDVSLVAVPAFLLVLGLLVGLYAWRRRRFVARRHARLTAERLAREEEERRRREEERRSA